MAKTLEEAKNDARKTGNVWAQESLGREMTIRTGKNQRFTGRIVECAVKTVTLQGRHIVVQWAVTLEYNNNFNTRRSFLVSKLPA